MQPVALESLGPRIMICGPSNSGKSTLASALGMAINAPVVHLDQLRFEPHSDWTQRPDADFAADHDAAVAGDSWVIEGNYSALFQTRLGRATGIIVLGSDRWSGLYRYVRRTLFEAHRPGNLDGARDSLKWAMVHWIVVVQPARRGEMIRKLSAAGLPMLSLESLRELKLLYAAWSLPDPR